MKLYEFQQKIFNEVKEKELKNVGLFLEMGLGKTFLSSELSEYYNNKVLLVVCQKAKIKDWIAHYKEVYNKDLIELSKVKDTNILGGYYVVTYDILARRKYNFNKNLTLLLDESSLIKSPKTNRTKAILKIPSKNTILLSGSVCGGKYEFLYTQLKLLGYRESYKEYQSSFIIVKYSNLGYPIITGYKNEDKLFALIRKLGGFFVMTGETPIQLPDQKINIVAVKETHLYNYFEKNFFIRFYYKKNLVEMVGDTPTKELLYLRFLSGGYNENKISKVVDIVGGLSATRIIIFYNFVHELERLEEELQKFKRPFAYMNGDKKTLDIYYNNSNCILFVQFQSGALGLNLQQGNYIIYFSLPLSYDLWTQSLKRIHRIGQDKDCIYYILMCGIDNHIYNILETKKDYTLKLFDNRKER